MGIFGFWKSRGLPIDFSDENINELTKQSVLLARTLAENGQGSYVDYILRIRLSADSKNESEFRNLVISRELFGGSGALWEIYIENPTEYQKFKNQFCEYIDLIIRMGIRHKRIIQTRKLMPKLK